MKTFASVLQGVGFAGAAGCTAWFSPVAGMLVLFVEMVIVGVVLEAR